MELLELKATWQLFNEDVIRKDHVEENVIENSIHQKSKMEISGIRRSMHLKFIVGSVTACIGLATILIMILTPGYNPLSNLFSNTEALLFFIMLVLSISLMLRFNYRAYKRTKEVIKDQKNLRISLEKFIVAMRAAMTFNIYSDTFMSPVFITWVYYASAFKSHPLTYDVRTILLFVLPLLVSAFAYHFQRLSQQFKFGKYVEKLESYFSSLEKENDKKV